MRPRSSEVIFNFFSAKIDLRNLLTILFCLALCLETIACQCPVTALNAAELAKYEIIFRGKIVAVKQCGDRPGEATFEVTELYKGNTTKNFTVIFDCGQECAQQLLEGEEWVIYARYKQINNAQMVWCSRSRKYFHNTREDFYQVNTGVDYDDEISYLRKELGLHRLLDPQVVTNADRNEKPNTKQSAVILISSLLVIVVFYWLFNRLFK
jgi:hypothetical protein